MYSRSTTQQVFLCNPNPEGPAKTHHSGIVPCTRKPDNRWGDSQNPAYGTDSPRQTHQSDHVQLMLRNAFIASMLDSFHQKESCRRVHPQITQAGDLQQADTVRPAALLQLLSNPLAFCKLRLQISIVRDLRQQWNTPMSLTGVGHGAKCPPMHTIKAECLPLVRACAIDAA